jgi:hypothetical protein
VAIHAGSHQAGVAQVLAQAQVALHGAHDHLQGPFVEGVRAQSDCGQFGGDEGGQVDVVQGQQLLGVADATLDVFVAQQGQALHLCFHRPPGPWVIVFKHDRISVQSAGYKRYDAKSICRHRMGIRSNG